MKPKYAYVSLDGDEIVCKTHIHFGVSGTVYPAIPAHVGGNARFARSSGLPANYFRCIDLNKYKRVK